MTARTTLILGGARSGKSRRAQSLAESIGPRRTILVTAEAFDDEMRERIARHRRDRDASWRTVEAPLTLPTALAAATTEATGRSTAPPTGRTTMPEAEATGPHVTNEIPDGTSPGTDVVLVDCLTLWLSNLVLGEHDVEAASDELLATLERAKLPVVLVSNEVGFGLVPETPLGRRFRDAQGRLNQRVADACERVELVVAGQPLVVRAESVATSGARPDAEPRPVPTTTPGR